MPKFLSVNIDHIATIREARKVREPEPVAAAILAELAGANGITVHLRQDRRHINDSDVHLLRHTITTSLNLEMAVSQEMVAFAKSVVPNMVTLVPEGANELTTEGGLNVDGRLNEVSEAVSALRSSGILVSLFIDAKVEQVKASRRAGADFIEFHTGPFADAFELHRADALEQELSKLHDQTILATKSGLRVNAGHGLNYRNVKLISSINGIEELNIGHSIISRAALVGIDSAVRDMLALM
ncbi:pyridoxine 5'-phosphate synthase [Fibrobacterales bacterium]|nr:pyridoxine 5'-phosphate synthase [Fibrobacterales bacterium]